MKNITATTKLWEFDTPCTVRMQHGWATIEYDEDPINPRSEFEHKSVLVTFENRFYSPDDPDFRDFETTLADILEQCYPNASNPDGFYQLAEYYPKLALKLAAKHVPIRLIRHDHNGDLMVSSDFTIDYMVGYGLAYIRPSNMQNMSLEEGYKELDLDLGEYIEYLEKPQYRYSYVSDSLERDSLCGIDEEFTLSDLETYIDDKFVLTEDSSLILM